jgi:hypothetical protein
LAYDQLFAQSTGRHLQQLVRIDGRQLLTRESLLVSYLVAVLELIHGIAHGRSGKRSDCSTQQSAFDGVAVS